VPFKPVLKKIASPAALFFLMPWLMVLIVAGTLAQKELGLYAAQNLFFSSWILWIGPIPLPGGYLTLAALTLCLSIKFLFFSEWVWPKAGSHIVHLGVLLLLIGGGITALTQKEGFILLQEGAQSNQIADYHQRVFTITKNDAPILILPFRKAVEQGEFSAPTIPFNLTIQGYCIHCEARAATEDKDRKGIAAKVELIPAPLQKENEANMHGLTLRVENAPEDQNGIYVSVEDLPHQPEITIGDDRYGFFAGRAMRTLPFEIELTDFQKTVYPGTDKAQTYSSLINVHDGTGSPPWPHHIEMNKPLRFKGYTLYQASYSIRPDGEYSVISVVENKGRIFPYLASLVILIGLLVHLGIKTIKQGNGA
jgi:hypothetical protein